MRTQSQTLINHLEGLGVILSCNKNRLSIDAPQGVITPQLRAQLKTAKQEILSTLLHQTPTLAHNNQRTIKPSKVNTTTKIYHIKVSGKGITVIDPSAMPEKQMKEILAAKFGSRLEGFTND
ncbi:hypothetical protein JYU12_02325 [bacterium AH-315-K03]|nr:hypothetical protein [bacterium AH-315-K03]